MTSLQDIYALLSEAQDKMDLAKQHFQEAQELLTVAKMHLLGRLHPHREELEKMDTSQLEAILKESGIDLPQNRTIDNDFLINVILKQQ